MHIPAPRGYHIFEVNTVEFIVRKNLGTNDRVIRGIMALYLFVTGLSTATLPVWGHLVLFALGVGFLLEAISGY